MEVSGRIGECVNDQIDAGSAEEPSVLCQPCGSEGDSVPAIAYCDNCTEYFCADCVKFHRKQAISKNHSILDGDQMPKNVFQESEACTELCAKHKNELVRFYCRTHDVVGCGDCRILDHKECSVCLIKEVSDAYVNSRELGEIRDKIQQVRKDIKEIKQGIQTKGQSLNDNHDKVLDDIKAFRKEINDSLDKMEAKVRKLAKKLKREKEFILSDVEKGCTTMETEIGDMEKDLTVSLSNNEHFVRAKRAKMRLSAVDVEIQSLKGQSKVLYHKFEPNWEITETVQSGKMLGEMISTPLSPFDDLEPKYFGEINLKQSNDTVCYITDIVQTEKGKAVLVDRNNTCIKVVDLQKNEILSVFSFCNRPFGIAAVNSALVVVTVPAAQKIQFLTYNTELSERYSLDVSGNCIGIDCRNNLLALTYTSPSKAEIMTLTGTVLHTIKTNNIQIPSYIIFGQEPKTLFISNYHRGTVKKYDFNGKILGAYKNEYSINPAGLTVTKAGTVFICNAGEVRRNVQMMASSDCRKIKDMLRHGADRIESPRCILFCEETGRLYVANGTGSLAHNCNTLKVYQC